MKKTVKIIALLLGIIFLFSACSLSGNENKSEKKLTKELIGKWVLSYDFETQGNRIPEEIEFFDDFIVKINSDTSGKYSVEGEYLTIAIWKTEQYTYSFKVYKEKLLLKYSQTDVDDNQTYIYLKSDSDELKKQQSKKIKRGVSDLALSCDAILASGTEPNGDLYEMVVTEEETAADVKLKVGFIKNGEWLREPTDDNVFCEDDYNNIKDYKLNDDSNSSIRLFDYAGFGAFTNHSSYYNSETGKSVTVRDNSTSVNYYYFDAVSPSKIDAERKIIVAGESKTSGMYSSDSCIYIIDITNMSVNKIDKSIGVGMSFKGSTQRLYGLSDGLFAVCKERTMNDILDIKEYLMFYNTKGELVADLSDYYIDMSRSDEGFVNGKYTFVAVNENENWFRVTIDKSGDVISEERIEG